MLKMLKDQQFGFHEQIFRIAPASSAFSFRSLPSVEFAIWNVGIPCLKRFP